MILPRRVDFDIVLYRAKMSLLSEVGRTYLSFLWWLFDPLLDLVLYYTVIGVILQRGGPGFVLDLLVGILLMRWFATATNGSVDQLASNLSLMSMIKLPKYIFPLTAVAVNTTKFIMVYILFLAGTVLAGHSPNLTYFAIIPLLIIQLLFIIGSAFIVSGITPFFPDFTMIYGKLTMIIFWTSGVFFKAEDLLHGKLLTIFYLNPLAVFIKFQRDIINGHGLDWGFFIYTVVFSMVVLIVGFVFLGHFDKEYPRMVLQR